MTQKLIVEHSEGIARLTLNMPETRNAITDPDLCDALCNAMHWLNKSPTIRCAILTGAGKAFSSGGNLRHMRDRSGIFAGNPMQIRDGYRGGIQRAARAVWSVEVPLIAAVNGPAYGAGCDLAFFCDIRIAARSALFAENFVNVGLIPGDGGAWILPRQIGMSRAAEMAFTADPVDAEKAQSWGMVSDVVEDDVLIERAMQTARRIARNPPRQLRMTKRLMREGTNTTLDQLLELSAVIQGAMHHTQDHREAVSALLEKREAVFDGS